MIFSQRVLSRISFALVTGLGFAFISVAIMLPIEAQSAASLSLVTANGRHLVRNGAPFEVRGMNYYPKDFAWDRFWLNYTVASAQINQELDKAKLLGVNTVRIFTPYRLCSNTLQTAPYPGYLADFIGRLQARDMVAIVTLFDFYANDSPAAYAPTDYPASKQHLSTVVNTLGVTNPTILAWDIKNELDREYSSFGLSQVKAWATEMINYTRQLDPNHLLTIGFYGAVTGTLCYDPGVITQSYSPTIAAEFAPSVDFVSMHYFLSERCFESDLQALQSQVGNKPIVLEEFGLPTLSNSALTKSPHTETEQAAYYNALLSVSESYGLAGYLFWTLNDFSYIMPGSSQWEHCLGVLRNSNVNVCQVTNPSNYSEKPAAERVHRHYEQRMAYLDLFDAWVDPNTDEPPAGWSNNKGALLRGYNVSPAPNYLLWSRDPGKVALAKLVPPGAPVIGIAASPILTNINVNQYPFLTGQVYNYNVRDASNGSHSILHLGVKEGGPITRLLTITPDHSLPYCFNLDLRQPPTNWNGTHNFQIILELVPISSQDGYSAVYEFEWLAIEAGSSGNCVYLPLIIKEL